MKEKNIMANTNAQKKKEIEDIVTKYRADISILKKKRDSLVSNFLKALEDKKLDEVRTLIKKL